MSRAERYITRCMDQGELTVSDIAELTRVAQGVLGVDVDGMPGPLTLAALEEPPEPEPIPDDLPQLEVDDEGRGQD